VKLHRSARCWQSKKFWETGFGGVLDFNRVVPWAGKNLGSFQTVGGSRNAVEFRPSIPIA
jgi:hypothetical protein